MLRVAVHMLSFVIVLSDDYMSVIMNSVGMLNGIMQYV